MSLLFAAVLFGIGLYILLDDYRFTGRARRAIAFVRAVERVVTTGSETGLDRRHRTRTVVTWKTRFAFKAEDGREHAGEADLSYPHVPAPAWAGL